MEHERHGEESRNPAGRGPLFDVDLSLPSVRRLLQVVASVERELRRDAERQAEGQPTARVEPIEGS